MFDNINTILQPPDSMWITINSEVYDECTGLLTKNRSMYLGWFSKLKKIVRKQEFIELSWNVNSFTENYWLG